MSQSQDSDGGVVKKSRRDKRFQDSVVVTRYEEQGNSKGQYDAQKFSSFRYLGWLAGSG